MLSLDTHSSSLPHFHYSSLILAKPTSRRMAGTLQGCLFQVRFLSLFLSLSSLNLEAKFVSFEERLGCRSDYCFIQWLHYFSVKSPPGGPWRLWLPEYYSTISLQSHQDLRGPKLRTMGDWSPGVVPGRITSWPPVGNIAKHYTP